MAQRRCDSAWFEVWWQEEVLGILEQGCLRLGSEGTGRQEPLISDCSMLIPFHAWPGFSSSLFSQTQLTGLAHGSLEPSAGGHLPLCRGKQHHTSDERLRPLLQIPTAQMGCLVSSLGSSKPLTGQEHIPKGGAAALGPLWLWAIVESGLSLSWAYHVSPLLRAWGVDTEGQRGRDVWRERMLQGTPHWEDI